MVEAWPSASFVVPKPDLLLEILVVALDAPAHLGDVDEPAEGGALGQRCEPVFRGSSSPSGHSTSSVSSARSLARRIGEVRTRTRAQRDASRSFVPSRHVTVR